MFSVNFTEHLPPGEERRRLVQTVDRDEPDEDQLARAPPVCYFIVGGNEGGFFTLDSHRHDIMAIRALDREVTSQFTLVVKATEDCQQVPPEEAFFRPEDDTLLKVTVHVDDINDNQPKFVRRLFTGGVTTESDYGAEVITVQVSRGHCAVEVITGQIRATWQRLSQFRKSRSRDIGHRRSG